MFFDAYLTLHKSIDRRGDEVTIKLLLSAKQGKSTRYDYSM